MAYPNCSTTPSSDFSTANLMTSEFSPRRVVAGLVDDRTPLNNIGFRMSLGVEISKIQNFVNSKRLGTSGVPVEFIYGKTALLSTELNLGTNAVIIKKLNNSGQIAIRDTVNTSRILVLYSGYIQFTTSESAQDAMPYISSNRGLNIKSNSGYNISLESTNAVSTSYKSTNDIIYVGSGFTSTVSFGDGISTYKSSKDNFGLSIDRRYIRFLHKYGGASTYDEDVSISIYPGSANGSDGKLMMTADGGITITANSSVLPLEITSSNLGVLVNGKQFIQLTSNTTGGYVKLLSDTNCTLQSLNGNIVLITSGDGIQVKDSRYINKSYTLIERDAIRYKWDGVEYDNKFHINSDGELWLNSTADLHLSSDDYITIGAGDAHITTTSRYNSSTYVNTSEVTCYAPWINITGTLECNINGGKNIQLTAADIIKFKVNPYTSDYGISIGNNSAGTGTTLTIGEYTISPSTGSVGYTTPCTHIDNTGIRFNTSSENFASIRYSSGKLNIINQTSEVYISAYSAIREVVGLSNVEISGYGVALSRKGGMVRIYDDGTNITTYVYANSSGGMVDISAPVISLNGALKLHEFTSIPTEASVDTTNSWIWIQGTDIKCRINGVTYTLTKV